ncbi:MAG TPA: type VI secretion system accessory protein TagJ [Stellaceae bacterium]|nr:type VI secretion system accessory protein TagJ [Stellaceae bacterium]
MSATEIAQMMETGDLPAALAAATSYVQKAPGDTGARYLLAELLCFTGAYERADAQLAIVMNQDPSSMVPVGLLRHLIRAETARQDWYRSGRPPEFLVAMNETARLHLEAGVKARAGDAASAARDLAEAESLRRPHAGICNGQDFDDFRDLDDSCGGLLEVLSADGQYFWVDFDDIAALHFEAPRRPSELLWRQTRLALRDGSTGTVYVPTIYAGTESGSDQHRLGRVTDWVERDGMVLGQGQRCFLVGDESLGLLDLKSIEFAHAAQ